MVETCCCGMFLLFMFTTLIAFVYHFVVRWWSYFNDKNVKYVRGVPFLGSAYKSVIGIEPAAVAYRRCYDQFPKEKFVGIYEFGGRPSYLVRNPDLIKQLLITDFDHFENHAVENDLFLHILSGLQGSKWYQSTHDLSPTFSANKIRSMHTLMVKTSEKFTNTLKDADKTAKIFDTRNLFTRYANDIIASTALGIELNSLHDTDNQLFVAGCALSEFSYINALKFLANASFPTPVKLLDVCMAEEKNAKTIKKIIKETIESKKAQKGTRNDLIDFLIKAQDGQSQNDGEEDQTNVGFAVTVERPIDNKANEKLQSKSADCVKI